MSPGQVRCGRLPHFRSKGDKRHPRIEGFLNVNVCSNSQSWKELSPMKLGPIQIVEPHMLTLDYPTGIHPGFQDIGQGLQSCLATNFENYWQSSKINEVDLIRNEWGQTYVGRSFLERRGRIMLDPKPHRRALPRGYTGYSYFAGNFYTYSEARQLWYCRLYAQFIVQQPKFQQLWNLHQAGQNIQIIGFDGRDVPITEESMQREMARVELPFGHELVICCLLTGLRPWEAKSS